MKNAAAFLVCLAILSNPLSADLWAPPTEKDYYSPNKECLVHVTPGTYTIKAVWDKAKPYTFGDDYIKGPPQPGDCESKNAPTITVKAGQTLENINIDCTNKVANGPD